MATFLSVKQNKTRDLAQRHTSLNEIARLHLMVQMDFCQNFILFFGVAALCVTRIGDFKRKQDRVVNSSGSDKANLYCTEGQHNKN